MTSPIGYSCLRPSTPVNAATAYQNNGMASSSTGSAVPHSSRIRPDSRARSLQFLTEKKQIPEFLSTLQKTIESAGFRLRLVPGLEKLCKAGLVRVHCESEKIENCASEKIEIQIDAYHVWKLQKDATPLEDALAYAEVLAEGCKKLRGSGFRLCETTCPDQGVDYMTGKVPFMQPKAGDREWALKPFKRNLALALDYARAIFIVCDRMSYTEWIGNVPVTRSFDLRPDFMLPAEHSVVIDRMRKLVWVNPLAAHPEPLADRVTTAINANHAAILSLSLEAVAAVRNFAQLSIGSPTTHLV